MKLQPQQSALFSRTNEDKADLDSQIQELQKVVDYEIREYPVEVIVDKFTKGLEEDEAELYIPDYQREFIWLPPQQSRFIESILLNLPIPYIFVADIAGGKYEGRLEIVDGSQRVRTLEAFMGDRLKLSGLKKITKANGFYFSELSVPRQLRFKRKTLRMIELTETTDEESRREIFDRLNSGGTKIRSMEQRRGVQDGPFLTFIEKCVDTALFKQLCPVSEARVKHKEYPELVLRYFAYSDNYMQFNKRVDSFLDEYLKQANAAHNDTINAAKTVEFNSMLSFVNEHFPAGFKKNDSNSSVPRIRFESIAVGVTLALRINPNLVPTNVVSWLESKEFKNHTRSDASNSRPKVINRVHFVRDSLLNRPVEYVAGGDFENEVEAATFMDEQE
jgi:Protein of unknown function DUF262